MSMFAKCLLRNSPCVRSYSTSNAALCDFSKQQNFATFRYNRPYRWRCPGSGRAVHGVICAVPSVESSQIQAAEKIPDQESSASPYRKRKVAMWVGYVGTAFKGLQIIRGPEAVNTVENELERAIYKAGGILDTNYGHMDKISWSRSSRTDKGVHSLATVISMKMEIPTSGWVGDPDGLLLAEMINMHLPPTIQVFGIVPVTKSFDARRFCCNRTYQYLLPASLIGISGASSPEKIGQIVDDFRCVLNMFQGRYAFHNYTVRSLYRTAGNKPKKPWVKGDRWTSIPAPVKKSSVDNIPEEDDFEEDAELENPPVKILPEKSDDLPIIEYRKAYWLDAPDLSDKISASHFRRILECSCGGLESYNGVQFVRISITGESFMVHQIRKIVATAVAVAGGVLPSNIIPLSLCRHARVVLPLAPSEGLVLARNSFYPYRQLLTPATERQFRESDVGISRLKELPKLELSRGMSDKIDLFWRNVLLPELALQLDGSMPVWCIWLENLPQAAISEFEIGELNARYSNWRIESQLKMEAEDRQQLSDSMALSKLEEVDSK